MIKILAVGDEQRVTELLEHGLEGSGYQVEPAYDGVQGLRLLRAEEFQMVIPDIILPKMSGFKLCKEIQNTNGWVPVLTLTVSGTTGDKLDGLDTGADDYIVKPFDFHKLNTRIKVLLKRRLPGISETQLAELVYVDSCVDRQTKTVYRQEREIKLSPRGHSLLLYMAENPEWLLTRVEITDKMWDTHFDTGTDFIDIYANYLHKRINRDYDVKLIHTKFGMGLISRQEL